VTEYIATCRNRKVNPWNTTKPPSDASKTIRFKHFTERSLAKYGYSPGKNSGWVCAQRRVGFGLAKKAEAYRKGGELPDYLILIDDDTFINIDRFVKRMKAVDNKLVPNVYAGRLFNFNDEINFPWGGFGTIFNRASLELLIQPLYCVDDLSHTYSNKFEANACSRLNENLLEEKNVYKSGMSISDLAYAMSARDYFCMHSDHLTGYLVNQYLLSQLNPGGKYRIHGYGGKVSRKHSCSEENDICHWMTYPGYMQMEALTGYHKNITSSFLTRVVPGFFYRWFSSQNTQYVDVGSSRINT